MTEIYSKIDPDKLLHFIIRHDEIMVERFDAVCDKERLQVAVLNMHQGKTFKAHRHIERGVHTAIPTQESWLVVTGKVMCMFYDTDGEDCIDTAILHPGDLSVTLYGGHNYEAMENNTRVIEYKSGPYFGQSLDKMFI